MLKKLSLLLAAVTLCTNIGIVAPVSAQDSVEETVLVQSNFQNCNFGTYTEENQMDDEADLRNGVVMVDDSELTTGYTINNGTEYEPISEADIVNDGGTKVLRLNTFLSTEYDVNTIDNYPIVKTTEKLPKNGKVRIDLELKMSPRVSFYMHHSKPVEGNFRIWRLENGNATLSKIRVLESTDTGKTSPCNVYNTYTVIMDTATGKMDFYLNGEFIYTAMGKLPSEDKELFFKHVSLNDETVKPVVTYNTEDNTKIESVTNPQYVYVKSLKMTTYTDTSLESVTPVGGSRVMTPKEAVFTFNKEIKSVEKAEVYDCDSSESVDVTSFLIRDGKTVRVPYAFEDDRNYEIALTSASDGMTSVDATTSFKAESWKYSNITENPAVASPENKNRYLINEDFTNSTSDSRDTMILPTNTSDGWYLEAPGTASIVELEDGNKAIEIATTAETLFQIQQAPKKGNLDNTTTLSFDVYIEEGSNTFALYREQGAGRVLIASWFKGAWDGIPMTAGQWHKIVITISDIAGTSLYVDGKLLVNTPKDPATPSISATGYFRFVVNRANVKIDNLQLYLNKNKTVLTSVAPAFNAMDVKVSEPLVFTYNEIIGDLSGAKLILKPSDTNEEIVLTDGNGMSVSSEGSSVKITLSEALKENTGYALEFSGIKNTADTEVEPIKTRFSTVYDQSWEVKDFEGVAESESTKKYSVKVKNETDAEGARMAVAVYDENGNLKDVVFSAPATSGNDWIELSATVNYSEGNTSKIFIWDSLEDMNLINGIISD